MILIYCIHIFFWIVNIVFHCISYVIFFWLDKTIWINGSCLELPFDPRLLRLVISCHPIWAWNGSNGTGFTSSSRGLSWWNVVKMKRPDSSADRMRPGFSGSKKMEEWCWTAWTNHFDRYNKSRYLHVLTVSLRSSHFDKAKVKSAVNKRCNLVCRYVTCVRDSWGADTKRSSHRSLGCRGSSFLPGHRLECPTNPDGAVSSPLKVWSKETISLCLKVHGFTSTDLSVLLLSSTVQYCKRNNFLVRHNSRWTVLVFDSLMSVRCIIWATMKYK